MDADARARRGEEVARAIAKLRVLPLASGLPGHAPLLDPVAAAFREQAGVEIVPVEPDAVAAEPAHVLLVLTGGTESQALELAARARAVVLLSHPGHNSLPAALEIAARLRQDGRPVRLAHLGAESPSLPVLAQAIALARGLRGKRVGLVGTPSPWLVASSPSPRVVGDALGIQVAEFPLDALLARLPAHGTGRPEGAGVGIGDEERGMAARVYAALDRLVRDERLAGLTVACFGLLPHRMTACWALCRLSDAGVPAGCEGDLPALIALLVAQELTGGPGFLANPADVDLKRGTLTLAHCTVPLRLTRSHRLRPHFESGIGLAVGGRVNPGAYTLVRFGGARLEQGFFVEGTVTDEDVAREDLCRTQVRFKMPKGAIGRLLAEPLGNHHVLVPGHHRAVLTEFRDLFLAGQP
jgi:L-fucose isomerase-like protein